MLQAVRTRHLQRRHERLDPARERVAGVGPHVAHDVRLEGQQLSFLIKSSRDFVPLLVTVERRRKVLLPVFGPLYRTLQALSGDGHKQLFTADDALLPKTSADIGRYDTNALLRKLQDVCKRGTHYVRYLRGGMQD